MTFDERNAGKFCSILMEMKKPRATVFRYFLMFLGQVFLQTQNCLRNTFCVLKTK